MRILEEKIFNLEQKLKKEAYIVKEMLEKSIKSVNQKDENLAKDVFTDNEAKINEMEKEIEEEAIDLIALHQPEAVDLRTIIMILKINNDLERIADHAVNIAQTTIHLVQKPYDKPSIDLDKMSNSAIKMLSDILRAFEEKNAELAMEVCRADDQVDIANIELTKQLITYTANDPKSMDHVFSLIIIIRNLERICDLTTNIAEDIIYMLKGEMIKHKYHVSKI